MRDKKPAKIRALVEIEFDALTSNKDAIKVMVREKFYRNMRNKISIEELLIVDAGDF